MVRQPLCIDNQSHQITQLNAIKVLLRHLERRYTAKGINNHVDSTNGKKVFFSIKDFDLLKPLTNFSIEGVCSNKPSRQLLCKDYNRLHFEELRRNYWLFPSSNSWQLYETTRLDCATTLTSSVGISNQKHISMMANTFNASQ